MTEFLAMQLPLVRLSQLLLLMMMMMIAMLMVTMMIDDGLLAQGSSLRASFLLGLCDFMPVPEV